MPAAAEMRERLEKLNPGLERSYGTTLALRIGVNTGEVVAGDGRETFVTGDAVNVAARLEQAATPGEILLGEETCRLARCGRGGADEADRRQGQGRRPFSPTGSSRSRPSRQCGLSRRRSWAGRPSWSRSSRPSRRPWPPALAACSRVVGEPGVGKSRLAAEVETRVARGEKVLRGRCLPYGEGITYWPLAEIVRQAASIHDEHSPEEARRRISSLVHEGEKAALVAHAVAHAVGLGEGTVTPEEIAWGAGRLLALHARHSPLLVVVDDLQWAEPTLIELLRGLSEQLQDAPVLLLFLARPELLDANTGLVTARLGPLAARDSAMLLDRALPQMRLDVRERLVQRAGGNPLFLEELAALVGEQKNAAEELPTTLNALLAARLDRLPEPERTVLERASIEGEIFHRGGVVALSVSGERGDVASCLERLTARELIRPARADFVNEAAFRFHHILVRDAAYQGAPKKLRAELHERYADWLEQTAGERVPEYEEILGYHLEQAYRYREELGPVDDAGRALAERASERLFSAADRAGKQRGDYPAAENLLTRALSLRPHGDAYRAEILLRLSWTRFNHGDLAGDASFAHEAIQAAVAAGDAGLEWRARLREATVSMWRGAPTDDLVRVATSALEVFDEIGYDRGAQAAWGSLQIAYSWRGRFAAAIDALDRCHEYRRRAGEPHQDGDFAYLAGALLFGPTPVEEAIARVEDPAPRDRQRLHAGPTHAHAWVARGYGRALRPRAGAL